MLNRAGVLGVVGELMTRRVPEHVRVHEARKAHFLPRTGQERATMGIGQPPLPTTLAKGRQCLLP
jgi:hypothetical protein